MYNISIQYDFRKKKKNKDALIISVWGCLDKGLIIVYAILLINRYSRFIVA